MISVTVVGDPDKVSSYINTVIGLGNTIYSVTKTKNNATYIITYDSGVGPTEFYLLMETGDYLLLETGDKIILE